MAADCSFPFCSEKGPTGVASVWHWCHDALLRKTQSRRTKQREQSLGMQNRTCIILLPHILRACFRAALDSAHLQCRLQHFLVASSHYRFAVAAHPGGSDTGSRGMCRCMRFWSLRASSRQCWQHTRLSACLLTGRSEKQIQNVPL